MAAALGDWKYKLIVAPLLAFALALSILCPCQRLLCCHLPHFWIAIAGAALGVVAANGGLRFYDGECARAAHESLAALGL